MTHTGYFLNSALRWRVMVPLFTMVATVLVATTQGASAQQASPARSAKPSVMIVFDGSGSMWGRIAGTQLPKFEAAREALRSALMPYGKHIDVGLVTFGQSSSGSCAVAEVAAAPRAGQALTVVERLEKFNPQGRGPVVLGLETAVQALKSMPGPRHVILIHDDPDNCGQDLCSTVAEIQKTTPELRIHVVFLTPKPNQKGSMACLSKTGGKVFEVDDAEAATTAIEKVVALASASRSDGFDGRQPDGPQGNGDQRNESRRAEPAPTPGLTLRAVLTDGGKPLASGVAWRVTTEDGKPAAPAGQLAGAQPSIALNPGRYVVEARAGLRTLRQTVTVEPGVRTPFAANFKAARLLLGATLKAGAQRLTQAVFEVTPLEGGDGKPVWYGTAPAEPLLVAPGRYRVSVSAGRVSHQQDVELDAGQTSDQRLALKAGYLALEAKPPSEDVTQDLIFSVAVDDPQQPSGRRVVARSAATAPVFLLPVGTYYVSVQQGHASTQDLVGITAGDTVRKVLNLHAMALTVRQRLKGATELPDAPVKTTIWRVDNGQQGGVVARSTKPDPTFRLAPGRYRVLGVVGGQNARMLRQFSVGSEDEGELVLEHVAGTLQLSVAKGLKTGAGASSDEIYWRVYDRAGHAVFRSTGMAPKVVLNVGTYQVRADFGASQFRDTVVVTSGQQVVLTVGKSR